MKPKVAVFGGVFDPIHNGHMAAARRVLDSLNPQKLFLVPAGRPPHKQARRVSPADDRCEMTRLAAEMLGPRVQVSRYEVDKRGYSYSVDTLEYFRSLYAQESLYFVIGSDNVSTIHRWYDWRRIPQLAQVVVVARPGYDVRQAQAVLPDCLLLEESAVELSSTRVRDAAHGGGNIDGMVCPAVAQYIRERRLYPRRVTDKALIEAEVRRMMSPGRFEHTLYVQQEALRLARHYGADEHCACVAALLHDYAKDMSEAQLLNLCERYGIITDNVQVRQPQLLHALVGEAAAYHVFGIDDMRILNAVRYHTTGCGEMELLTKILFIADCIEPSRTYEGVERIRALAYEDLDRACLVAIEETMEFLIRNHKLIHPDALLARNDLLMNDCSGGLAPKEQSKVQK